jgi:hypothetical protein
MRNVFSLRVRGRVDLRNRFFLPDLGDFGDSTAERETLDVDGGLL